MQLADEIQRSGRPVTLAVGEHVRMPRRYRGRDIFWWMDAAGVLDERYDEVDDIVRARHVPSPQLIGTPERAIIDLNVLPSHGVRIVGPPRADHRRRRRSSPARWPTSCALADLKMNRLLEPFDEWARQPASTTGRAAQRFSRPASPRPPLLEIDLDARRHPHHRLGDRLPARLLVARRARARPPAAAIRHDGGVVTDAPGMYVLGMPFLRRRRSSFISGAAGDTAELADPPPTAGSTGAGAAAPWSQNGHGSFRMGPNRAGPSGNRFDQKRR